MKRKKPKKEDKKLFLPPLSQTAQMRNFLLQMPVPALLSSLETTVNILTEKGIEIKDWEESATSSHSGKRGKTHGQGRKRG